jgi:biopolymer transport protein ExbB
MVTAAAIGTTALAQPSAPGAPANSPAVSQPATSPSPVETPAAPASEAPGASVIASGALPRDLSPWGMFLNADIVVKIVMVGLVFASLVTWTVWLAKNLELWKATRNGRAALAVLNEARSLAEAKGRLGKSDETVARLLRTAVHEVQMSPHPDPEALKERISWLLERVEASSSRRIGRGMGLLASIGATAPFVGLFGTVWGIMNSFIGISNAHTTNLAVLARDRRLSCAARGRLGAGDAAGQPRLRARIVGAHLARRGGVAPWPSGSDTTATISRKPTRSTSRRSST